MANNSSEVRINLAFTADTKEAKRQIQDLQQSLQDVIKTPNVGGPSYGISAKTFQEATQAAAELQKHLQAAVDVNTGKLDLSRFSVSLKASNTSLTECSQKLLAIGSEGEAAFLKLAQSIATAEAPVTRINQTLRNFGDTLLRTARWQISSTAIHAITGTISSAYNYAKDLNESLNRIRIVTGQSTDQMARFAEQANKAAKELGSTTTAYTDAALIFYQQGEFSTPPTF